MLKAFAVYDVKAEAYGRPMFIATEGLAVRGFEAACADPKSPFREHPEDYRMFEIGTWDPRTGKLTSLDQPKYLTGAVAVILRLDAQSLKAKESSVEEVTTHGA